MVVEPKVRNNIFMNAHPAGCAKEVENQIDYVTEKGNVTNGCKNALIIGSSTGYGLASRITAAFGCGAATIGVFYEKEGSEKRTGTSGYYNDKAFVKAAREKGLYAESFNGDAFSDEMRKEVIDLIRKDLGTVDLVVYSLASGRRTDPRTGNTYTSALKPIGEVYKAKSVDPQSRTVTNVEIEPANEEEISNTVKVMGGEDWTYWIQALSDAGVLAEGAKTVAYSYIGPEITYPVYWNGTIGKAKEDLENTVPKLDEILKSLNGKSYVSVNKALATKASAVIPVVPLYMALLFKTMKEKGIHEGCIEQIYRLFDERLYIDGETPVDEKGRIRIDDWEMREDVQKAIMDQWDSVNTENLEELTDIEGYWTDFLKAHGFAVEGVDYSADVDTL